MDQKLRSLLRETINPDDSVRRVAEEQLRALEKSPEVLRCIEGELMRDQDLVMQQISSVFFLNILRRHWDSPEIAEERSRLEATILGLLQTDSRFSRNAYTGILRLILERSTDACRQHLVELSISHLGSADDASVRSALVLYEFLCKAEIARTTAEDPLVYLFASHGDLFLSRFNDMLARRVYTNAKMFMKVLSRVYVHYTLPSFLNRLDVFRAFFESATGIVSDLSFASQQGAPGAASSPAPLSDSEARARQKLRKWALFFLLKAANKGLKQYFKNPALSEFVRSSPVLNTLFGTFWNVMKEFTAGADLHPRIPVFVCDFFILAAGNSLTRSTMRGAAQVLLESFILPTQSYNEEIREMFEYEPEKYLWTRYNFVSSDLRSSTLSLFLELVQIDSGLREGILKTLVEWFPTARPELRYGILGLLSSPNSRLYAFLGRARYNDFVRACVATSLFECEHEYLVSQSLYFFAQANGQKIDNELLLSAMKRILEISGLDPPHPVLSVEACIAMQCFLSVPGIRASVEPLVPALLEQVLVFSRYHFLEYLSNLMDTIVDQFTDAVTAHAPQFASTLSAGALAHIGSRDDSKYMAVSSFLVTIEKLVFAADERRDIVQKVYEPAARVIYEIFAKCFEDFYQEGLDLMNAFLFSLKAVDESMLRILEQILSSVKADELSLYPSEMADLFDNFLSFGENMIYDQLLLRMAKVVDLFIRQEAMTEDDIFDEDFKAGCRIIESIALNCASRLASIGQGAVLASFVTRLLVNWESVAAMSNKGASSSSNLDVYCSEALMNCFIADPEAALRAANNYRHCLRGSEKEEPLRADSDCVSLSTLFNALFTRHRKFKRVHDKKIFLLFIGRLFGLSYTKYVALAEGEMDFGRVNEALVSVFESLPEAIRARNKIKARMALPSSSSDSSADSGIADGSTGTYYDTDKSLAERSTANGAGSVRVATGEVGNSSGCNASCEARDHQHQHDKVCDEDNHEEESYSEYDSDYDSMAEDVWFETVLDRFDAYAYIRQVLQHPVPGSIGATAIASLEPGQVSRLGEILAGVQEQQK